MLSRKYVVNGFTIRDLLIKVVIVCNKPLACRL